MWCLACHARVEWGKEPEKKPKKICFLRPQEKTSCFRSSIKLGSSNLIKEYPEQIKAALGNPDDEVIVFYFIVERTTGVMFLM